MKFRFLRIAFSILLPLLLIKNAFPQKKPIFNCTEFKLGAPIPLSQTTFKTYWTPRIEADISGLRLIKNNFHVGIEFSYSLFQCRWIHQLKSSMHIINPNICVVYNLMNSKKIQVFPEFSLGYSWLFLTNPETPSAYLKKYKESGLSLKPGINLSYAFRRFSMGVTGSYKIIFTIYGINGVDLYDMKKEADFISYITAGLFFRKCF